MLILTLGTMAGCASQSVVSQQEIDDAVAAQAAWFDSLAPDQSVDAVIKPVLAYQQSSFEVLSHGTVHQYVQGQFPVTRVLFGLYFRDGFLTSLILDQQVGDFGWCRTQSYASAHWLADKSNSFSPWLQQSNQIGGSFNPRLQHPPMQRGRMSAGDIAESAGYLPVIAVALPLYGIERLAGGMQRDRKKRMLNQRLMATAMAFQLGETTRDNVLRALGSADQTQTIGETEIWRYRGPGLWIGIVNGVVMWKESGSPYPPKNSAVNYSRDCTDILGPR